MSSKKQETNDVLRALFSEEEIRQIEAARKKPAHSQTEEDREIQIQAMARLSYAKALLDVWDEHEQSGQMAIGGATPRKTCTGCRGTGHIVCPECQGSRKCRSCAGSGKETFRGELITCYKCRGGGVCLVCRGQGGGICRNCNGTGYWD